MRETSMAAPATTPVGVIVAIEAQLALVTVVLVVLLILERRLIPLAADNPLDVPRNPQHRLPGSG